MTHVYHLAAQAGVRKSWGRDFSVYTVNNIEATQVLLEAITGHGHIERFRDPLQAARADAIDALFVFLDLLEGHADTVG